MSPQRSDLVLTPDIPDSKADVLILNGLYIKSNGRNGGDDLSELKLVQDSSLTSCIETYHENSHLFLSKKPAEKLGERQPHFSQLRKRAVFALVQIYCPSLSL
ncbi:hypothetical protein CQW23_35836 [Capsicum baccatum]|uniref:Uncharacterized protein n=1 Tax=Capsicum baccatum TaxID=33114 RepID=A0A2G2UUK3_CAPBA|nr:hypothetical protein CQW23_35836 [Capsicum baccatum]